MCKDMFLDRTKVAYFKHEDGPDYRRPTAVKVRRIVDDGEEMAALEINFGKKFVEICLSKNDLDKLMLV